MPDLAALLTYPIIQGPMAGGASTPELAAAVSNAGALGSLAVSLLAPETIVEQAARIRSLTDRPFCLNLFVQQTPAPSDADIDQAAELLRPAWSALGWDSLPRPASWCQDFNAQFDAFLDIKPAVASFTFGILSKEQVARLHEAGILVIGTVTTVEEGMAWQEAGADAVVASGIESGGHRGTFIGRQEDATLTGESLWPAVAHALAIPVIAAGGIMDGADIRAALALGAVAVQMGTAFLVTDEAGIHSAYRARLLDHQPKPTRLTRAISGRYARGIENRFIREMAAVESQVPPYPVQNALTGSIRAAAGTNHDPEWMSLWAGTGVDRARAMPAATLVYTLVSEMQDN
ncbi:NAD(P)H-dependent flavin oxidoreductase [Massilia sp. S19_KUP03_FR1]|uniref:NAD(P)H-dependent flavin oxidoreductase n=1 Tax=Massilia sp. S19_KUP03_FR1 TaxID=3025503 RepID=UPI002FCD7BC7